MLYELHSDPCLPNNGLRLRVYPKVSVVGGSAGGMLHGGLSEDPTVHVRGSDGAQMNYRRYVLERLLVGVGEVRQPDDERCSRILVNRITEKDVQSFNTNR